MKTFETENQLQEWREIESQHFDPDGNAYAGQTMAHCTQEQMLKLINQLCDELSRVEKDEKFILGKMDSMCVESLPPHDYENWDRIKKSLKLVRKEL